MPPFAYSARDAAAQVRKGVEEAASAAALASALRGRGWLVTDVRPAPEGRKRSWNPLAWLPPRSVDIELGLQQLAVMVRSGLTLLAALRTVAEQASRPSVQRLWSEIADAIQQGSGLAEAMTAQGRFPAMVVQLLGVGEQTGTLEPVLTRAAEALQRRRLLKTHLLSAMAYPAVVVVAALGVGAYMVLVLIPKLQVVLTALGKKLPAITQALLDFSAFSQNELPGIILGILILTGSLYGLYLSPRVRLAVDRVMLRLPLLGRLLRLSATVQFAYAQGTLLRSGVTLVEALGTVSRLQSNAYARQVVSAARTAVMRGGTLADQLPVRGVFMPMLTRMVAVGEASGTLDDVLEEVALFHEGQLQAAIRLLSVLIEPAVVIVVGGMVGFIYIAFFMAFFAVSGNVK